MLEGVTTESSQLVYGNLMRCWMLSIWLNPVGSWQEVTVTFRLLFWGMFHSLALEIKTCTLAYDLRWRLICKPQSKEWGHVPQAWWKRNWPSQREQAHDGISEKATLRKAGNTAVSVRWRHAEIICAKAKHFCVLWNKTITRHENRGICVLVCRKLLGFPKILLTW